MQRDVRGAGMSASKPPFPGAVWTGTEWVEAREYELRRAAGHNLPPLQPVHPWAAQKSPLCDCGSPAHAHHPDDHEDDGAEEPFGGHGYAVHHTLDGQELRVPTEPPPVCSCPSGDGSLRWPCAVHPPEAGSTAAAAAGLQAMGRAFACVEVPDPPAPQPHFAFRALEHLTDTMRQLLPCIDPNHERPGLLETPERAAKAWLEWTAGYAQDPASVLKVFEDGAEGCNEMVVVHDIPVYSHCEHHLAPIFGTATVAYIPNGRIVGLSKLPRLVDIFARRLQVQERMTNQIADAIMEHLNPRGCGVVMRARHMCMESRGIKQGGSHTTTSALRGCFSLPEVRAEFLTLRSKS
jgi:GTP cyclohydrolase I